MQIHFKGPSSEIGRLLSNMISNVNLKLEISNVNAGLKKYIKKKKRVHRFFPVNTEHVTKQL